MKPVRMEKRTLDKGPVAITLRLKSEQYMNTFPDGLSFSFAEKNQFNHAGKSGKISDNLWRQLWSARPWAFTAEHDSARKKEIESD